MRFLLYSQYDDVTIRDNLGRPDYSYFFVMRAYRPILERIGKVQILERIYPDADEAFGLAKLAGEPCVFLSFAPPHQTPLDLKGPVVPVFAWEFGTIPDETWDDDPRNDWRYVFSRTGRAITLASCTAAVTKAAMGEDFPIVAASAPCWDRMAHLRAAPRAAAPTERVVIAANGYLIDTRTAALSPTYVLEHGLLPPDYFLKLDEVKRAEQALIDRENALIAAVKAKKDRRWHRRVRRRLDPRPLGRAVSAEFMALARAALGPPRKTAPPPPPARPPRLETHLDGVVFTSVFCPRDGRKNWLDIIKAFCIAFRDTADATLVLKLVSDPERTYVPLLMEELSKLAPFACRVLAIDAYMDTEEYDQLMRATAFYVNASLCEGQCMPLMEFMAAGTPAVSPQHTAMADYVTPENAFIVAATREQNVWPHDPRHRYNTFRYRIDWETLHAGLREAYRVAKADPRAYAAMSAAAIEGVRAYGSNAEVEERLRAFFAAPPRPRDSALLAPARPASGYADAAI